MSLMYLCSCNNIFLLLVLLRSQFQMSKDYAINLFYKKNYNI